MASINGGASKRFMPIGSYLNSNETRAANSPKIPSITGSFVVYENKPTNLPDIFTTCPDLVRFQPNSGFFSQKIMPHMSFVPVPHNNFISVNSFDPNAPLINPYVSGPFNMGHNPFTNTQT